MNVDNFAEEYDVPYQNPFVMPNMRELVKVFPESVPYARKKIQALDKCYKEKEPELKERLTEVIEKIHMSDDPKLDKEYAPQFWSLWIYELPLQKIADKRKYFEKIIKADLWNHPPENYDKDSIQERDIAVAKEYPLEHFVEGKRRDGFAPCPFHQEKTPSFKIYKDNHFHCYGCNEHGDVIDLIMKMRNIEFISAVKFLLNK